jgi:hypothetical protein
MISPGHMTGDAGNRRVHVSNILNAPGTGAFEKILLGMARGADLLGIQDQSAGVRRAQRTVARQAGYGVERFLLGRIHFIALKLRGKSFGRVARIAIGGSYLAVLHPADCLTVARGLPHALLLGVTCLAGCKAGVVRYYLLIFGPYDGKNAGNRGYDGAYQNRFPGLLRYHGLKSPCFADPLADRRFMILKIAIPA